MVWNQPQWLVSGFGLLRVCHSFSQPPKWQNWVKTYIVKSTGILCFYRFYRDCSNWSKHEYVDPIYFTTETSTYSYQPAGSGLTGLVLHMMSASICTGFFTRMIESIEQSRQATCIRDFHGCSCSSRGAMDNEYLLFVAADEAYLILGHIWVCRKKSLKANLQNLTVDHRLTH